jgi:hypothetical protein
MEKVLVKPSAFKQFKVSVVGQPPGLIMNRFGNKGSLNPGPGPKPREVRDEKWILEKCENALHKHNGGYGIPSTAFKKGMIRMIKQRGAKMVDANTWFFVLGDLSPIIETSGWEPRTDHVRLSNRSFSLAHRPHFNDWVCELTFEYDASMINKETLLSLLEDAGRLGVLEWRPSSGTPGPYGTYKIKTGK